jgi:hypothetical protein
VPGVFSRDENDRHQNLIENTIWQCFEGFMNMHLDFEPPFSWFQNFLQGECRVVPVSVRNLKTICEIVKN